MDQSDNGRWAIRISAILFGLSGLSTVLNTILIPYLREVLHLSYRNLALIDTCFYFAYFVMSPIAGLLNRTGDYVRGIRMALAIGMIGPLIIASTGLYLSFSTVLIGIFVLGCGIAILQVNTNPYVIQLGDADSASSRLSMAQSITYLGALIAPFLGSIFILGRVSQGPAEAFLVTPYLMLAALWLAMSLVVCWLPRAPTQQQADRVVTVSYSHVLRDKVVWIGMLGIALTVGVEMSTASFMINYLASDRILDISTASAARWCSLFWLGFVVGRMVGSRLLQQIPAAKLLLTHTLAGMALATVAITGTGWIAAGAAISLGLCSSVLFPVIFSLVMAHTDSPKQMVSGCLCMANIGGALMPVLQGALADRYGIQASFSFPLMCYAALAVYTTVAWMPRMVFQTRGQV